MKTIAITGGIGGGKSLVSDILRASGYQVYDSDTRAKILTATSPGIKKSLISMFGKEVYDEGGNLDKKMLADKLFSDEKCRAAINAIIHPVVFADFNKWREKQKCSVSFIESAILFESRFDKFVDEVWCVTAPVEIRVERVMRRNGISREHVLERMASQMPEEAVRSKSTHEIINDGETPVLPQLLKIFPQI